MISLLQAMARQEGFYVAGTRAARNNNPGNIEYGEFAKNMGAIGSDGRFAIFDKAEDGFDAMRVLLLRNYRGLTLEAAIHKWAPPVENESNLYVRNVSQWTGIPPTAVIDGYLNEPA